MARSKDKPVKPQQTPEPSLHDVPPPPATSDQGAGDPPPASPRVLLTYKKALPCVLTVAEQRQRSLDLTQAIHAVAAEQARQASIKAENKGILMKLQDKVDSLVRTVEYNTEDRDVEIVKRLVGNFIEETRADTGAVITRREPTEGELQEPMPLRDADFERGDDLEDYPVANRDGAGSE